MCKNSDTNLFILISIDFLFLTFLDSFILKNMSEGKNTEV